MSLKTSVLAFQLLAPLPPVTKPELENYIWIFTKNCWKDVRRYIPFIGSLN